MDKRRVNKLVREIARGNTAAAEELYALMKRPLMSFARAENDALYFAGESANVAGTVLYTNEAEGAYLYAFEYGGLYYYFESGASLSEEIEAFLENG